MKMFKFIIPVLLVLTVYASAETKSLFIIERSKNSNIVKYDANIEEDGIISVKNPVDAYWIVNEDKGQREEINAFQKQAYGYKIKFNDQGYFDMTMSAVEDRNIKVILVNGEPKAEIIINGKKAYLDKIYINSKDNFMGIPKVLYYTLTGSNVETGEELVEKIEV